MSLIHFIKIGSTHARVLDIVVVNFKIVKMLNGHLEKKVKGHGI